MGLRGLVLGKNQLEDPQKVLQENSTPVHYWCACGIYEMHIGTYLFLYIFKESIIQRSYKLPGIIRVPCHLYFQVIHFNFPISIRPHAFYLGSRGRFFVQRTFEIFKIYIRRESELEIHFTILKNRITFKSTFQTKYV